MTELMQVGSVYDAAGNLNRQTLGAFDGFEQVRARMTVQRHRRVNEAARLYADAVAGIVDPFFIKQAMNPTSEVHVAWLAEKYPNLYDFNGGRQMPLRETMSVTDYQALFVDVLDRLYYGYYSEYPIPNMGLVKQHPLRDFRLVSRYLLDGMVTPLTAVENLPAGTNFPGDAAEPAPQRALQPPVPQDGSTYAAGGNAPPLQYRPKLYQAMGSVNWRAFVNDDLGIFNDIARRLGIAGRRGIHKAITQTYMDSNGPHASLYTAAYKNQIITANGASINNPPLNAQGVADAMKILAGMVDSGGDPIMMQGKATLWYGPQYVAAAQNLKRSLNMYLTQEGGVAGSAQPGMFVNVENWIMEDLELCMDPYIPIVSTSHKGSWGLTIDPNTLERPSVEFGMLRGFETPQLYQKLPNTQRMGGGVDAMMGDFYTMDQDTKIITVFGSLQIDGRSTVASNGSSS